MYRRSITNDERKKLVELGWYILAIPRDLIGRKTVAYF
jgi:hypothetical protein